MTTSFQSQNLIFTASSIKSLNMKKISLLILLCICNIAFSQLAKPTTIIVIGNIHDSVPNYHPQILFDILESVKPDLILHEVDSASANDYFSLRTGGNELAASTKYIKYHPNTKRATFDFEGRNNYRKALGMVPADNLTVKLIDSLYKNNLLTVKEKAYYESYTNYTNDLKQVADLSPKDFNSTKNDALSEKRQNAQHHGLVNITNSRKEFANHYVTKPDGSKISYRDGYQLWTDFWDTRNKTMAKNILKHAKENKGKTIVVLTGFLHRYYIIKELKKNKPADVILKEFYE